MRKFSSKRCECVRNCTHTFYVWAMDQDGRLVFVDGHPGGTTPTEKLGVMPKDFHADVLYVGLDEEVKMLRDLAEQR